MTYLLDTNVCIAYLRGSNSAVLSRMRGLSPNDVSVCSIVSMELFYGAQRSSDPDSQMDVVKQFLEPIECIAIDEEIAEVAARDRSALAALGTPIGPYDLLIAATAKSRALTLITHNTREFSRVSGLNLDDWER